MAKVNKEVERIIDKETSINGKPVRYKEWENDGYLFQKFHFSTRDREKAVSLYFERYWFAPYSEEEKVYGPGRPVTAKFRIKRNGHNTFVIVQKLVFGDV